MPAGARIAIPLAAALAAALAGHAPAAAGRPELVLGVGSTLAARGDPGGGGASLALALVWPLEGRYRVGVMGFADALGDRTGRLTGPDGTDLGPVAEVHRAAAGAALRVEGHLPGWRAIAPYLAATWGVVRVRDDVRGTELGTDVAAGFGLGMGLLRALNGRHAAGLALRAQQLSRGDASRYLGAALEWRWGPGGEESPRPAPASGGPPAQ